MWIKEKKIKSEYLFCYSSSESPFPILFQNVFGLKLINSVKMFLMIFDMFWSTVKNHQFEKKK
jgi:hypothetical protein